MFILSITLLFDGDGRIRVSGSVEMRSYDTVYHEKCKDCTGKRLISTSTYCTGVLNPGLRLLTETVGGIR